MATDERNREDKGNVATQSNTARRNRKRDELMEELAPVIVSIVGSELPAPPPKPAAGEVWVTLIESSHWGGKEQSGLMPLTTTDSEPALRLSPEGFGGASIWRSREDVERLSRPAPVQAPASAPLGDAVGAPLAPNEGERGTAPRTPEVAMPDLVMETATPVVAEPVAEGVIEAPAIEAHSIAAPAVEAPVDEAPVDEVPVVEAPVVEALVVEAGEIKVVRVEAPAAEPVGEDAPAPEDAAVGQVVEPTPVPIEVAAATGPSLAQLVVESTAANTPPPVPAAVVDRSACATAKAACAASVCSPCRPADVVSVVPVEDLLPGVVSVVASGIGGLIHGGRDLGSMLVQGIGRGGRAMKSGLRKVTGS
jgi:hypothetical protein